MKIGKNNFKPPPAVESSVVRIVPKIPKPGISYEEWDGLLRVCFVRKNRTLRAGFLGTSKIMEGLEGRYRTWCAENNVPVDEGVETKAGDEMLQNGGNETMDVDHAEEEPKDEEGDAWEGIMDVDDEDELPDFFKNGQPTQISGTGPKRKKRGKVSELVREKIRRILEEKTGLADKRARLCDEADFLKLLWEFNQEGIHFD